MLPVVDDFEVCPFGRVELGAKFRNQVAARDEITDGNDVSDRAAAGR